MTSFFRMTPLAASVAIVLGLFALGLGCASPSTAAEAAVPTSQAAAKTSSAIHQRHTPPGRVATWRSIGRFCSLPRNSGCSGIWCGRQFVLMVGIAY